MYSLFRNHFTVQCIRVLFFILLESEFLYIYEYRIDRETKENAKQLKNRWSGEEIENGAPWT